MTAQWTWVRSAVGMANSWDSAGGVGAAAGMARETGGFGCGRRASLAAVSGGMVRRHGK